QQPASLRATRFIVVRFHLLQEDRFDALCLANTRFKVRCFPTRPGMISFPQKDFQDTSYLRGPSQPPFADAD
ncbi:MAG: hypothetical protein RJP95_03970, partial [Pirellulales bacterium]